MKQLPLILLCVLMLSACDNAAEKPAPAASEAPSASSSPAAGWVGKWVGVEGLSLTISKDEALGEGNYLLTMQYSLDATDKGTFKGKATPQGMTFTRPDGEHTLRAGDGAATGLKWLAEKKDCLVVQPGEGYCR
ncbi:hypothetical protein [Erwinia sp.]|uniref:hypothetical protein n=1 Tax=Erwinia citreus TaxID=558 RepID=UPI003C720698